MKNWLKKRLSPVKKAASRWQELAEALESLWEAEFDAEYTKAAALKSIYTADLQGQKMILREMGYYFEDAIPDSNVPIAVGLRKLELRQKETEVPLRWALRRLKIRAEWLPLYMPPDGNYALQPFYTFAEIEKQGIAPADCLLTSRGILLIDISKMPISEATIDLAIRRCRNILPLHIIFDRCRLVAELFCRNMPKIGIANTIGEVSIVFPYQESVLTSMGTAKIMGLTIHQLETAEIWPKMI